MSIKRRSFFLTKEGYRAEKHMVVEGKDGVKYFIVDLITGERGTPKTPYPHLMVIRNDARITGSAERHPPEFFGMSWRSTE